MMPMIKAHHGSTSAHPAVIETAPARIPFAMASKSNLYSWFYPVIYFLVKKEVIPAVEGAMMVFTIAREALVHPSFGSVSPREDPPLKNIQPTQRIMVPRTILFGLDAEKPLSLNVVP